MIPLVYDAAPGNDPAGGALSKQERMDTRGEIIQGNGENSLGSRRCAGMSHTHGVNNSCGDPC